MDRFNSFQLDSDVIPIWYHTSSTINKFTYSVPDSRCCTMLDTRLLYISWLVLPLLLTFSAADDKTSTLNTPSFTFGLSLCKSASAALTARSGTWKHNIIILSTTPKGIRKCKLKKLYVLDGHRYWWKIVWLERWRWLNKYKMGGESPPPLNFQSLIKI